MLPLLCLVLSCWALGASVPVPPATGPACVASSLLLETISNIEKLQGNREISPPNNITPREEWEGSAITYLEEFIKVLESRRETPMERQIAQELRSIHAAGKTCYGRMEHEWEPEEKDFYSNLEYLLRFLNHYGH
uniref:Uncharacterized protein n=1 Tax=Anser brachyrhynchus TaxID=132585 RepID=A0A8B9CI74_9AVES